MCRGTHQSLTFTGINGSSSHYGIVDLDGQQLKVGQSVRIDNAVEKPDIDKAPSNLSIVGRYVFSPKLSGCLKRTPLGVGDEMQLTDAVGLFMK